MSASVRRQEQVKARYVISTREPLAIVAGDEWYPEACEMVDVIVEDARPTDTGLVDQHGVTIYRMPVRERCGF